MINTQTEPYYANENYVTITSSNYVCACYRYMEQLIGTIQTANKWISTFRPTCFDLVFCQNNHWIFCWF